MDPIRPDILEYQRARFTARLPSAYLYTPGHFWIARAGSLWRIGLTKFASRILGETVDYGFDLESGAPLSSGQVIGWIEGFKAVSSLF